MTASSSLGRQIAEVTEALGNAGIPCALIGGLALASYQVVRATQDVDLLAPLDMSETIDGMLIQLGYRCLHRDTNAGNYVRNRERVDFLYASRPIALRLLRNARPITTALGPLCVVSAEGLIGFKLQGWVNDALRTQDLEDIKALLRANRSQLDMNEVREYFRLFDKEYLLDELLCNLP